MCPAPLSRTNFGCARTKETKDGVHGSIVTGAPPLCSFCSFITSEKAVIGGLEAEQLQWEMKIDASPRLGIRSENKGSTKPETNCQ